MLTSLSTKAFSQASSGPMCCRRCRLGQDSDDAEYVSIGPDESARHRCNGITLETGRQDDLGIRGLIEPDQRFENLPAVRHMPGGAVYLVLHVKTRGCSRWPVDLWSLPEGECNVWWATLDSNQ